MRILSIKSLLRFALLVSFAFLIGCSRTEPLLSSVTEDEANQAVSALLKNGVDAKKITSGDKVNVVVPSDQLARSVGILRANGVPRTRYSKFEDIFPGSSFTSSPTEERARYIYLLSQSIESTLSSIEGVVLARVHIVLPQKATFLDPSVPATASVMLQHLPSVDISTLSLDIQRLVANSVPGLVPERVTVMILENTSNGENHHGGVQTPLALETKVGDAHHSSYTHAQASGAQENHMQTPAHRGHSWLYWGIISIVILALVSGLGYVAYVVLMRGDGKLLSNLARRRRRSGG